jgi:hypothetical protein
MARQERYFIGPGVREKLTEVFTYIGNSRTSIGSGSSDKAKLQHMQRNGVGSRMRLCKTSSSFNKGAVTTLSVWEDGSPPNETQTDGEFVENVINKYADIAAQKWVSVAQHGNGRWYVVAAECEAPPP